MDITISVSNELTSLCEEASLGVLQYRAQVSNSAPFLTALFDERIGAIAERYSIEDVAKNAHIAATRAAYKKLGKDPHAYRNAAEAMLRRIVKGKGLYHINNVVDINNLISVSSGYSIGSYDLGMLRGDIELRRAGDNTYYEGIGKASVNIAYMPTLYDAEGPFGNPTSDSRRASIQEGTHDILSVVYSFDGPEEITVLLNEFASLLRRYCGTDEVKQWIV